MASNERPFSSKLDSVMNWNWSELIKAEMSEPAGKDSVLDVVLTLVRSIREGKLAATRLALDRLSGKLETKIRVEVPGFYALYPYATSVAGELPEGDKPRSKAVTPAPSAEGGDTQARLDVKALSLRETIRELSVLPSSATKAVLAHADAYEMNLKDGEPLPPKVQDPLVKSVMAASFLETTKGKDANTQSIAELIDQVEGKIEKVVRLMGEDVYITKFDEVAPYGAVKNADGVYQLEEKAMTTLWKTKLIGENDDDYERYND